MRPENIVSTLAVAVSPHAPGLARRQLLSGTTPDILDQVPPDCAAAMEAVVSGMPAEPTLFAELSSSYYETAERTATTPSEDCAWITEMPEAAHTAYGDYVVEQFEWMSGPDGQGLVLRVNDACQEVMMDESVDLSVPCDAEWSDFAFDVILEDDGFDFPTPTASASGQPTGGPKNDDEDGLDFAPDTTESDSSSDGDGGDEAEDDQDSGASVLTSSVAALLATFVGGLAML